VAAQPSFAAQRMTILREPLFIKGMRGPAVPAQARLCVQALIRRSTFEITDKSVVDAVAAT
jgi:hypothetical protein